MKKIIGMLVVAVAMFAIGQSSLKSEVATSNDNQSFVSVAAEQSFEAQGDMSVVVTDSQVATSVKVGSESENYAASFSCSTGCSMSCSSNCSRSCSTCCSHQCGRGY